MCGTCTLFGHCGLYGWVNFDNGGSNLLRQMAYALIRIKEKTAGMAEQCTCMYMYCEVCSVHVSRCTH